MGLRKAVNTLPESMNTARPRNPATRNRVTETTTHH